MSTCDSPMLCVRCNWPLEECQYPKENMSDIAPDTAGSSAITSHAFTPRGEWWTVCRVCGLAEAAHTSSTQNSVTDATLGTDSERKSHE